LPPGVSQRDLDGPEDEERKPCGCEKDCDCMGPNPKAAFRCEFCGAAAEFHGDKDLCWQCFQEATQCKTST